MFNAERPHKDAPLDKNINATLSQLASELDQMWDKNGKGHEDDDNFWIAGGLQGKTAEQILKLAEKPLRVVGIFSDWSHFQITNRTLEEIAEAYGRKHLQMNFRDLGENKVTHFMYDPTVFPDESAAYAACRREMKREGEGHGGRICRTEGLWKIIQSEGLALDKEYSIIGV